MHSFRMLMLALLPALAVVGCEAKSGGVVTGKVTYKGQPVAGEVAFYAKEIGAGATTQLDAEGNYTFDTPLRAATYAVSVTPPPPTPGDPNAKTGPVKAAATELPAKFRDPATSGVTVTVVDGTNNLPITLPE